jgi:hypothetical protein
MLSELLDDALAGENTMLLFGLDSGCRRETIARKSSDRQNQARIAEAAAEQRV